MNKKRYYLLALMFVFIILIMLFHKNNYNKDKIINYVQENHFELKKISEKMRENTMDTEYCYNEWRVTYWKNSGMVQFQLKDNNNLNSLYTGFYYSYDDIPLGFQGTDLKFVEQESGWIWHEDNNSDNWEYTEKIMDNWYWFEIHF